MENARTYLLGLAGGVALLAGVTGSASAMAPIKSGDTIAPAVSQVESVYWRHHYWHRHYWHRHYWHRRHWHRW